LFIKRKDDTLRVSLEHTEKDLTSRKRRKEVMWAMSS
jgi:predicted translin family RNA/ssDNA-binding protein